MPPDAENPEKPSEAEPPSRGISGSGGAGPGGVPSDAEDLAGGIYEDVEPVEGLDVEFGDQILHAPRNANERWRVDDRAWSDLVDRLRDELRGGLIEEMREAGVTLPTGSPVRKLTSLDEAASTTAPSGGLLRPREIQHTTKTRRLIAYLLVAILGLLVLTGCAGWFFLGRGKADFQAYAVMFSPVVTLVGTVLAFYFGSRQD